jgi:hypothetical protein
LSNTKTSHNVHRFFALLLITAGFVCSGARATEPQASQKLPNASPNAWNDSWSTVANRTWAGPETWANRLHDWRIEAGRLECVAPQRNIPLRTFYLLTRQLSAHPGSFELSVTCGLTADNPSAINADAAAGLLIGVGNGQMDYRAAAVVNGRTGRGAGFFCGVNAQGEPVLLDLEQPLPAAKATAAVQPFSGSVHLRLTGTPNQDGSVQLTLQVLDASKTKTLDSISQPVAADRLAGNLGLVSHPGVHEEAARAGLFWFQDWSIAGEKIEAHDDHTLGPIVCTQYTLSRNVLKMTAQFMPLEAAQPRQVTLQIQTPSGWKELATTQLITPGWTAPFRVAGWDASQDTPYRVVYHDQAGQEHLWTGTIPHDPVDQPTVTVAGLTGNHNNAHTAGLPYPKGQVLESCDWPTEMYFPHQDLTSRLAQHQPHVLFFSGDQLYEQDSPSFLDKKHLTYDYLYKWYLWCWAWQDLLRDHPSVCIPDDHDVYQGNVWGHNGRKAPGLDNTGGYVFDADWVNMVHRTQTSHLPDPYDPTPIEQNISVYYGDFNYGRISFAVIADRMFKSGCAGQGLPSSKTKRPDHFNDPEINPSTLDVPGLKLLGDRQIDFLEHWVGDWSHADLKVLLSQTIFANSATHHGPTLMRILNDLDSNGWPQTGRNRALEVLRKGFPFHLGGDQHLATLIHHGIEAQGDALWSFAVPSVANFYPRAWAPKQAGEYHFPEVEDYTGPFADGFGNIIEVVAATNPGRSTGKAPSHLHDNMPGYGIVKLNKPQRTITVECWPRYADPADPSTGGQYLGWPRTIQQTDNYARQPSGWLPALEIAGPANPVVRVFDESTGALVYALRIVGNHFQPHTFTCGPHTVEVGEPGTASVTRRTGLVPNQDASAAGTLDLEIPSPN